MGLRRRIPGAGLKKLSRLAKRIRSSIDATINCPRSINDVLLAGTSFPASRTPAARWQMLSAP